eukprot:tig00020904_g15197.t2
MEGDATASLSAAAAAGADPDTYSMRSRGRSRRLVAQLFESLHTRRLDLISDFGAGANDPFLLEFDSLVALACSDAAADWRRGCQTLHLVWLTECILQRFRERDAHVRVVVFDSHAALWPPGPAAAPARLARAVLLRHLLWLREEGRLELLRFESWAGPEWARFVSGEAPPLLLLGSRLAPPSLGLLRRGRGGDLQPGPEFEGADEDEDEDEEEDFDEPALQALAIWSLLHRVPVALTTGLEFRGMQAAAHACSSAPSAVSWEAAEAACLALCPRQVAPAPPPSGGPAAGARPAAGAGRLGLLVAAAATAATDPELGLESGLGPAAAARSAARVFALHGALAAGLPLRRRALQPVPFSAAGAAVFARACAALEALLPDAEGLQPQDVAQLADGRLYHALLARLAAPEGGALWSRLARCGREDGADLARLWAAHGLGDFWAPLEGLAEIAFEQDEEPLAEEDPEGERRLLPVSSPVLDQYFQSTPFGRPPPAAAAGAGAAQAVDAEAEEDEDEEPPVCVEKYHWHSGRLIVGDDGELADSSDDEDAKYRARAGPRGVIGRHWRRLKEIRAEDGGTAPAGFHWRPTPSELKIVERWRAEQKLRLDQKYTTWLHGYAESLHGAGVHAVSFAAAGARRAAAAAAAAAPAASAASAEFEGADEKKKGKPVAKGTKPPSKKELIVEANARRLQEKRADGDESKADAFFKETCQPLLKKKNAERAVALMKKFVDETLGRGSRGGRLRAKMRLVELCERAWLESGGGGGDKADLEKAARLYNLVLSVHEEFEGELRGPGAGGEDLAALCAALCRLGRGRGRPAGVSPARLQMGFGGRYMKREVEARADGRVLFTPDRWQRDLLDIVDRGDSALVVAPTSAGKTFAAFYAMEKARPPAPPFSLPPSPLPFLPSLPSLLPPPLHPPAPPPPRPHFDREPETDR